MSKNNPTTILRYLRLSLLSLGMLVSVALGQTSGELLAQQNPQQPPTFTPQSTFLAPAKLMDYWGDTPIPLSAYTEQELAMQRLINAEEDALVTQNTRSEATLSAPPESEAYLAGLRPFEQEPITPYTWKWVKLEMRRSAGNLLTVTLRRPHW